MAGSCVGYGVTVFSETMVAGLTIDAGAPEDSTKDRSRLATRSPPKLPVDMFFASRLIRLLRGEYNSSMDLVLVFGGVGL